MGEVLGTILSGALIIALCVLILNKRKIRRYLLENSDEIEEHIKKMWSKITRKK